MNTIAAVVVTYNRLQLLKDCIESLRQQTRKLDVIMVINNSSTDGTGEWLNDQNDLQIIHQDNGGGAAGFYRGMKEAYEKGFDWIWVMDDDVEPGPTCLVEMLSSNEAHNNEYDVLQPSRRYTDENLNWQYGGKFNFSNPFKDEAIHHISDAEFGERRILRFVSFPFEGPMFSRRVIEKVGFADKRFFICYDDTDYAIRVDRAGFKAGLVRDAFLIKKIKPCTTGLSVDWKLYYKVRNQIILDRKYGNPFIAFTRAAFYNIHRMLIIMKQSIERRSISNFFKDISFIGKAIIDGFRFKY